MSAELAQCTSVLLVVLILARSNRAKMWTKYPLFYAYLLYVLFQFLVGICIQPLNFDLSATLYWQTEILSVFLGFGVIWEVYSQALGPYPGAARVASALLSGALLLIVALIVIQTGVIHPARIPVEDAKDLERNLRELQGISLVPLLALLSYYSIPLGKNVKGMIAGYTLFVSAGILEHSLRADPGSQIQLRPVAFVASLVVWCTALWSYHPNLQTPDRLRTLIDTRLVSRMIRKALTPARRFTE